MSHAEPALTTLRDDLERLGYTVVPHGEELCVRLPLMCSVRIHRHERGVQFRAKFGPFSRSGGLLGTYAVASGSVAAAAIFGGPVLTSVVAFLGVVALVHDACRFIITENALTRLQQITDRAPAVR